MTGGRFARATLFGSAAALAWSHGGYLAFLRLLSLRRPEARKRPPGEAPPITVVVGVYNEEAVLSARLQNLLELDYPRDRVEIIVASDGSTDRTNEIAERYADRGVTLLAWSERRGRAAVTNDVMGRVRTEWVLFTDADARMQPDFLERLRPHMNDPSVGVVDGAMICVNADESSLADDVGLYWRFESLLKRAETRVGCLASTFGACTAVRRSVFRPLETMDDIDFITPLDAVAQGYRVVHEPDAIVHEYTHSDTSAQFGARVRMVTKNLPGTVRKLPEVDGLTRMGIVSHKLLRWTTPYFLLALLASTLALAPKRRRYRWLLFGQAGFYVAGGIGGIASRRGRVVPLGSTIFSFLVANAGFFVGTLAAARRKQVVTWEPYRGSSGAEDRDA